MPLQPSSLDRSKIPMMHTYQLNRVLLPGIERMVFLQILEGVVVGHHSLPMANRFPCSPCSQRRPDSLQHAETRFQVFELTTIAVVWRQKLVQAGVKFGLWIMTFR